MEIIRGTTPTIIISIQTEIDLSELSAAWIYISQQGKVRVCKDLDDITIDEQELTLSVALSQEDTLALKAGIETFFQIRLRMEDGTALATTAQKITIKEIYKDGVIE